MRSTCCAIPSAHLLAEAVRRLYPGVKIAIGPPIENGFYYDFEFPEPITEADLAQIEDEVRRELEEGREWSREEISRDEAKARFARRGRAVQGRARRHRRGRHLALHAGRLHRPLPRPAPAEREADQGVQADRPRRRLLARRRAQHAADPHLRHRLLLAGRPRRAPRAARGGARPRPPPARRRSSTSSTSRSISPGSPFWHPKGMVIWNVLEDLRRRENRARGYVEVQDAAHLRQGALGDARATGRSTARTCSVIPRRGRPTSSR